MADKKKADDTTAPPSSQASDYAGDLQYRDMPADKKPGPDSVAQEQIRPDEDGK